MNTYTCTACKERIEGLRAGLQHITKVHNGEARLSSSTDPQALAKRQAEIQANSVASSNPYGIKSGKNLMKRGILFKFF